MAVGVKITLGVPPSGILPQNLLMSAQQVVRVPVIPDLTSATEPVTVVNTSTDNLSLEYRYF